MLCVTTTVGWEVPCSGRGTMHAMADVGAPAAMTPFDRQSIALRFVEPHAHVESPDSKRRIHSILEVSNLTRVLDRIEPLPATDEALLRFHTQEYIDRLRTMSNGEGGCAGECAPFSPGAFDIALLSCGGVIQAVEAVVCGSVRNAYALVRPPGHHAERDKGRGFCLLGNVAISALHAQTELDVKRIVIIDWDVHHGNGTQQAFWDDGEVFFISIHQVASPFAALLASSFSPPPTVTLSPPPSVCVSTSLSALRCRLTVAPAQDRQYPLDSGLASECGTGKGEGTTLNIPLPPGCGHGAYLYAMEHACKAAAEHKPDLVIVSCGFDAAWTDPLGAMMCHSGTFREMTRMVRMVAER